MRESVDGLSDMAVADVQSETGETQPDRPCIAVLDARFNRRDQTARFCRLITLKQIFKIFLLPLDSLAVRLLSFITGEMIQRFFHSGSIPGFLLLRCIGVVTIRIIEAGTARDDKAVKRRSFPRRNECFSDQESQQESIVLRRLT